MSSERRIETRFEPRAVRAKVTAEKNSTTKKLFGIVVDASRDGIAVVTKAGNADWLDQGDVVAIQICYAVNALDEITDNDSTDLGNGVIKRRWSNTRGSGIALKLNSQVSDLASEMILSGPRKNTRVENQAKLAELDMDKVHGHVQFLHDCQLKLLIVGMTVGVSLCGVYLTLAYHSAVLGFNHSQAEELSFWRMWIAMLPGLLSLSIASIVLQKIASVARNEAFLTILKECRITGQYPREYRGWEDAYRKFKFCWNSKLCDQCKQGQCGEFSNEEKKLYNDLRLAWRSVPNVFHLVLFSILGMIGVLSLLAIINEVVKYGFSNGTTLILGIAFGSVLVLSAVMWLIIANRVRTGMYSFPARRRLWKDLLEKCPFQV